MAREIYELSDETRKVLSHNPQAIADEMGKHPSYIYDFLEMRQTDIFAKFVPLYNASIRAGAPFCYWDNRLASSRARYEKIYPVKNTIECFKDKLNAHHETITKVYEAMADGNITEDEIAEIQPLLEKEIAELTRLNLQLNFQRGVLQNGAKAR